MAYDLVVRNGTVVDGSGAPRQLADVAVAQGRIVVIGKIDEQGREEIDAALDRALLAWPTLARGDFAAATQKINSTPPAAVKENP